MCQTCEFVETMIGTDEASEAMNEIEKAIKAGASYEHFKELMDKVLGTEMEERDPEREKKWEHTYKLTRHLPGTEE